MAAPIDLDAARAARSEAEKEDRTVIFGGEEFTVGPMVPLAVIEAMAQGMLATAARELFGDEADRFFAHRPDDRDLVVLLEHLAGQPVGNSSASGGSSRSNGARSKRTSRATTK